MKSKKVRKNKLEAKKTKTSKSTDRFFYKFLFMGWLLIIVTATLYSLRYNLGIKSPNFSPGDCVFLDYGNEFEERGSLLRIVRVGKKNYEYLMLMRVGKDTYYQSSNKFEDSIESIDNRYEKVDCPAQVKTYE